MLKTVYVKNYCIQTIDFTQITKQVHIAYINHACWHRWLCSFSLLVGGVPGRNPYGAMWCSL